MAQQFAFDLRETEARAGQCYTLQGLATGHNRYHRIAGMIQDAAIWLVLEPYSGPTDFLLEWLVSEEQIHPEFIPSVIEGVQDAALAGRDECRPIIGVRIGVVDGKQHWINSHPYTFRKATEFAFHDALKGAALVTA